MGRWAARGCILGLWACALNCSGAAWKGESGVLGKPGGALPGAAYLLPHRLEKGAARILTRGGRVKAGTPAGEKGTLAVAPGINAFLSRAPSPAVSKEVVSKVETVKWSGPTATITAPAGATIGTNLFESFSQFSLKEGEVADFVGAPSVTDIIARVTGGMSSSIDGTIMSGIKGANLFLINPAGVMFGANAVVSVSGAFTVSTADYVNLSDGGKFLANGGPGDDPTAGAVSGFGFTSASPKGVSFTGSALGVPAGKSLNFIAGDVTLNDAKLSAPSGGLTVFSAASKGEVDFNVAAPGSNYNSSTATAFGALKLSAGSSMAIDGAGGGSVVVQAGAITLDDSSISAVNSGSTEGGSINLTGGAISIQNGGLIETTALSSGAAGCVNLGALSLNIMGAASNGGPRTGISALTESSGQGGAISVTVAGNLRIAADGIIDSESISPNGETESVTGNVGNVHVGAASMTITGDGQSAEQDPTEPGTGISSVTHSAGLGGTVTVTVQGQATVENGGTINTNTFGQRKGGAVSVQADSLSVVGPKTPGILTGIGAASYGAGQAGDTNVAVTGLIKIEAGGTIGGYTGYKGNAGSVTVTAGSLVIVGAPIPNISTGIADAALNGATGEVGDISVTVLGGDITVKTFGIIDTATNSPVDAGRVFVQGGAISIESGGLIDASTYNSSGNAGSVTVDAGSLSIVGDGPGPGTGIRSLTDDSSGNAGTVTVNSGAISIQDGGSIIASTSGSKGNGGSVTVQSASLVIAGSPNPNSPTGIGGDSIAGATGKAGDVIVEVSGNLTIEPGGSIGADTSTSGNAGTVSVHAGSLDIVGSGPNLGPNGALTVIGAKSIQSATGAAGSVSVTVNGALDIQNGGEITAATQTSGNAGDLSVQAGSLDIRGPSSGIIVASSATGNAGTAGDISVKSDALTLGDGGTISAIATNSSGGDIAIQIGGSMDLSGGAVAAAAGNSGGNITISTGFLSLKGDSTISANAVQGAGGTLFINMPLSAVLGQTSDFYLVGSDVVQSANSVISATSEDGIPGQLLTNGPHVDLLNSLVELPGSVVGTGVRLEETCAMAIQGQFSSFLAVGQGDVEAAPDEAQGDTGDAGRHIGQRIKARNGKAWHAETIRL